MYASSCNRQASLRHQDSLDANGEPYPVIELWLALISDRGASVFAIADFALLRGVENDATLRGLPQAAAEASNRTQAAYGMYLD